MSLKIYGIKTNDGYYITSNILGHSWKNHLSQCLVNGETPKDTFEKYWFKVEDEPKKIEKMISMPNINHRFILRDKSLESEKLPLEIKREVAQEQNNVGEWRWKPEYSSISLLYKLKYDEQEPQMKSVDFEYIEIAEIDKIIDPAQTEFTLDDRSWQSEKLRVISGNDTQSQLIDKIMFPTIMLGNKPKKLTSNQMYGIVRNYIKKHIDTRYAEITSDYNFCFEVKKVIHLSDPYEQKTEIMKQNGRPYKRPRYNTKYVADRKIVVFEMTHASDPYRGYTVIPSMVGEDIEDLKHKVDKYCKEIIDEINKPLVDCSHCGGLGVIINDEKD